jgi:hypothetical protein
MAREWVGRRAGAALLVWAGVAAGQPLACSSTSTPVAPLDASASDAPAGDGPIVDGATSDGATSDGSTSDDATGDALASDAFAEAGGPDGGADQDATGACTITSKSQLPGVSIVFPPTAPCTFTLGQAASGISIPYDIVVSQDVVGVVPKPQDAGGCGRPGNSGLIVLEDLRGGPDDYCLCDLGLCAPPSSMPVTLHAGTYPNAFTWTGHQWNGPSDTGNPKGPLFPPGDFVLTVTATGTKEGGTFTIEATLTIHLT